MAHLWVQTESDGWSVFPLVAELLSLPEALPAGGMGLCDGGGSAEAILLRSAGESGTRWVLLTASEGVRVNGLPLPTGIHVLDDRDEICLGGLRPVYFATEVLATVESFRASGRAVFCPRCTREIAPGAQCVTCPHCGVAYHQSQEYPCWTYSPGCALCNQSTELGTGYRWSPEEL
jgi:hypothetical protein